MPSILEAPTVDVEPRIEESPNEKAPKERAERARISARSPLRTPGGGVPIPTESVLLEDVRPAASEAPTDDASEPDFSFGEGDAFLPAGFVGAEERPRLREIAIDFAPQPADEVAHPYSEPPQALRSRSRAERSSDLPPEPSDVAARHRDPEARSMEETIELLHRAARAEGDPQARQRAAQAFADIAERLGGADHVSPSRLRTGDIDVHEVDDFGLDRAYEARMQPLVDALYDRWFRVLVRGAERVPRAGRALVVANHGGVLPWDGLMLKTAIARELPASEGEPTRELRWLVEDSLFHAPFLGAIANRLGAIRACPENAERVLQDERLVAVFPEGDKGIAKPFARRYELQRFGRGGYVKLALRMRAPIIPTAIVGAEEAHPMLFSTNRIAKLFGLKYLPFTATFPWLGPLGLLPLPSRWVILFGEPIDLSNEPASAAEDEVLVSRINDEVRGAVQDLLRKALSLRPQPYFG